MAIRSSLFLFCLCFHIFLCLSCSIKKDVRFTLLQGYLAYKQKDWEEANMKFLQAEEIASNNEDKKALYYIHYAQSATLLMQNEIEVASEKLRMIGKLGKEEEDVHFISSVYYQMGIICFIQNDYRSASSYFKKSLEVEPFNLDAKINYELSIREIENERIESLRKSVLNEMEGEEAYNTLLDVFRKREIEEWSEKKEKQQEDAVNDY